MTSVVANEGAFQFPTDVKQLWLFSVSFPNAHLPKSVVLCPPVRLSYRTRLFLAAWSRSHSHATRRQAFLLRWALLTAAACCLEPKIRRLLNKYRSCTSLFNLQLRLRSALVFLDVIKRFEWSDAVLYNFGIGPWLKKWIVRNFSMNSEFSISLGSKRGLRDKI